MPAHKPEDCDNLLVEALRRDDLEAAVAFYEPDAAFVLDSGEVVTGQAAVREALKAWIGLDDVRWTKPVRAYVSADGGLAWLRGSWAATAKRATGEPVTSTGESVEVVRRQPDGTWRFAIDHPRGAS